MSIHWGGRGAGHVSRWSASTTGVAALTLDFLTTTSLDSRITFTRSSTATFVGSNGLIQSAAINAPRLDYNSTTLAPKGLLIEEQRTNFIVNSTLDGGTTGSPGTPPTNWTQSTVGTATGTYALDTELAFTGYTYKTEVATSGRLMALQIMTALANTSYYLSVTVNITSGSEQILNYFGVASLPVGTTSAYYFDGIPVASTFVPTTGRHTLAILITVAAIAGVVQIRMGVGTFFGATAAANVTFRRPQFEAGTFSTSYIPTTASQATRSADVATMTGTNFSSWYNASAGTFVSQFTTSNVSGTSTILDANDNTANESIRLRTVTTNPTFTVTDGGVDQANIDAGTVAANATYKMAGAYAANDFAASISGGAAVTDVSGAIPTVNQLQLGSASAGNALNGCIRSIAYYNTRLLNSQLQALTV